MGMKIIQEVYYLYRVGLYFHHQTCLQQGFISALAQPLYSFWGHFSTLLQWHIGLLQTLGVHLSVLYISAISYGEGNGNPLQCSCLENPKDQRAWWADVCGVAQSRTQLK